MMSQSMFGYFDAPEQMLPAYDPGLLVDCPVCYRQLAFPMCTVSLMVPGDNRSYFYRVHKACFAELSEQMKCDLDSVLIDAIAMSKGAN